MSTASLPPRKCFVSVCDVKDEKCDPNTVYRLLRQPFTNEYSEWDRRKPDDPDRWQRLTGTNTDQLVWMDLDPQNPNPTLLRFYFEQQANQHFKIAFQKNGGPRTPFQLPGPRRNQNGEWRVLFMNTNWLFRVAPKSLYLHDPLARIPDVRQAHDKSFPTNARQRRPRSSNKEQKVTVPSVRRNSSEIVTVEQLYKSNEAKQIYRLIAPDLCSTIPITSNDDKGKIDSVKTETTYRVLWQMLTDLLYRCLLGIPDTEDPVNKLVGVQTTDTPDASRINSKIRTDDNNVNGDLQTEKRQIPYHFDTGRWSGNSKRKFTKEGTSILDALLATTTDKSYKYNNHIEGEAAVNKSLKTVEEFFKGAPNALKAPVTEEDGSYIYDKDTVTPADQQGQQVIKETIKSYDKLINTAGTKWRNKKVKEAWKKKPGYFKKKKEKQKKDGYKFEDLEYCHDVKYGQVVGNNNNIGLFFSSHVSQKKAKTTTTRKQDNKYKLSEIFGSPTPTEEWKTYLDIVPKWEIMQTFQTTPNDGTLLLKVMFLRLLSPYQVEKLTFTHKMQFLLEFYMRITIGPVKREYWQGLKVKTVAVKHNDHQTLRKDFIKTENDKVEMSLSYKNRKDWNKEYKNRFKDVPNAIIILTTMLRNFQEQAKSEKLINTALLFLGTDRINSKISSFWYDEEKETYYAIKGKKNQDGVLLRNDGKIIASTVTKNIEYLIDGGEDDHEYYLFDNIKCPTHNENENEIDLCLGSGTLRYQKFWKKNGLELRESPLSQILYRMLVPTGSKWNLEQKWSAVEHLIRRVTLGSDGDKEIKTWLGLNDDGKNHSEWSNDLDTKMKKNNRNSDNEQKSVCDLVLSQLIEKHQEEARLEKLLNDDVGAPYTLTQKVDMYWLFDNNSGSVSNTLKPLVYRSLLTPFQMKTYTDTQKLRVLLEFYMYITYKKNAEDVIDQTLSPTGWTKTKETTDESSWESWKTVHMPVLNKNESSVLTTMLTTEYKTHTDKEKEINNTWLISKSTHRYSNPNPKEDREQKNLQSLRLSKKYYNLWNVEPNPPTGLYSIKLPEFWKNEKKRNFLEFYGISDQDVKSLQYETIRPQVRLEERNQHTDKDKTTTTNSNINRLIRSPPAWILVSLLIPGVDNPRHIINAMTYLIYRALTLPEETPTDQDNLFASNFLTSTITKDEIQKWNHNRFRIHVITSLLCINVEGADVGDITFRYFIENSNTEKLVNLEAAINKKHGVAPNLEERREEWKNTTYDSSSDSSIGSDSSSDSSIRSDDDDSDSSF